MTDPTLPPAAKLTAPGKTIKNIQALRAVAAFSVIFVHLPRPSLQYPGLGSAGVDIFFVISGFIMTLVVGESPPSPLQFFRNRLIRVAPLYWFLTLLVFMIAFLRPILLHNASTSLIYLTKSLLFIPFQKSGGMVVPLLFVGWTLNFEMYFYALFSISLIWKNFARIIVIFTICALVTIGILIHPKGILPSFYTSARCLEFAMGIVIGIFYSKGYCVYFLKANSKLMIITCILSTVLAITCPMIIRSNYSYLISGIFGAYTVLFLVVLEDKNVAISNSVILLLGDASYSIYLTHPFVTQTFEFIFRQFLRIDVVAGLVDVSSIVAAAAFGSFVYIAVERPMTKAVKHIIAR